MSTVLRKDVDGNQYRARLRVSRSGSVWLSVVRVRGGILTRLGRETRVTGLRVVPGRSLLASDTHPRRRRTHIDARVWRAGTRQPARWNLSRIDRHASLGGRGRVGLRMALDPAATPPSSSQWMTSGSAA